MHILTILKLQYWAGLDHLQFLIPVAPSSPLSPTPLPLCCNGNKHTWGQCFCSGRVELFPHPNSPPPPARCFPRFLLFQSYRGELIHLLHEAIKTLPEAHCLQVSAAPECRGHWGVSSQGW